MTNYIHNAVYNLMKETGIKAGERFYLKTLRGRTVATGYFTDKYDFQIAEITKKTENMTDEVMLFHILWGDILIEPTERYKPANGDVYYCYLDKTNIAKKVWADQPDDFARHYIGNCFRTTVEAESKTDFYDMLCKQYEDYTSVVKSKTA